MKKIPYRYTHEQLAQWLAVHGTIRGGTNRALEMQQRHTAMSVEKDTVLAAAQAIVNLAQTEKRGLTTEESKAVQAKINAAKQIAISISTEQALAAASNIPTDARPGTGTGMRSTGAQVHDNALDEPWEPAARGQESTVERRQRLAIGFGRQLMAVRSAALSLGQNTDPRLLELERRSTPLGASEQVPADGGFLVYPDFSMEIMKIAHDTGIVYRDGYKIPITEVTNGIKIPGIDEQSRKDGSRWGGVRMFWQNEADSLIGTKPKFRLIELVLKKLTGLFYATDEVIADAGLLGSTVTQAFGEEVGFKMDDAALNGDGAGKPQGVIQGNNNALIVIPKEIGQAAQTLLFENVKKMWYRLHARSRANAVWYVNQDVEQQLLSMSQSVGTGGSSVVSGIAPNGPAFYVPAGLMGNATALLMGRPVMAIEQAQTLGTQGDIILVDMSQWVWIDKGPVQQATSMHVAFITDQMTFRWIYRVDGAPKWSTPLQPFAGTNTQSPYITLATRS